MLHSRTDSLVCDEAEGGLALAISLGTGLPAMDHMVNLDHLP